MWSYVSVLLALIPYSESFKVLQIVPGFTNSHVLFNYRLANSLVQQNNSVQLWTQMEMGMVVAGGLKLPKGVTELRIPIRFTNSLKAEGMKVFQAMMFESGTTYDLFWTGQEFKEMRLESCEQMLATDPKAVNSFVNQKFDLAIGHFHDLCPLALAKLANIKEVIWLTHGTSLYDYTAVQSGLRTFPSFVPHPLSSYSDRMTFTQRLINVLWHLGGLDFVNLPQNLLYDENDMFKKYFKESGSDDLWELSQKVRVILINGERFLDFPRPLPHGIQFMGSVSRPSQRAELPPEVERIVSSSKKIVIFSLGTVSNTTNMPFRMINSFVEAFGRFPEVTFLWRMEMDIPQANKYSNIKLLKWLPQKELMLHPKTALLIAHGGYNSFLEASQAGVPIVLMPLFADQFINAKRAQRFGISTMLDKLTLTPDKVATAISTILNDRTFNRRAQKLAAMLKEKPSNDFGYTLVNALRSSQFTRDHFALKAAQALNFLQFYNLDLSLLLLLPVLFVSY
ncbi:unnamed protein product [Bursaphelenchus xylophilus]|uniref:glucuronosyltransferase n=1 Tax=Bursaphelenchus xylophilus TaxID=6326 RepID=A0A1I7STP4_BURXY|nr:unnamed protein product [Bursaphelenchus xylophilus]CAG9108145.1 unnamed protein product [Bursaphelenchus xylophilus]